MSEFRSYFCAERGHGRAALGRGLKRVHEHTAHARAARERGASKARCVRILVRVKPCGPETHVVPR
jgi:hypothetical protein